MADIIKCVCSHIAGLHAEAGPEGPTTRCVKCGCRSYRPQEPGSLRLGDLETPAGDDGVIDFTKLREIKHGLLEGTPSTMSVLQEAGCDGGAVQQPERVTGEALPAMRQGATDEAQQPGAHPSSAMKLYLSGPIKGLPDYNAAAFKAAATMLRAYGYDVVCPTEMSEEMVVRRGVASRDDISYGDYLIEDLAVLRSVDNIALLDGWAASVGAKLEIEFARAIGLGVLLVDPQVPGGLRKLTAADEARAYVMGARQKSYGHPRDNFARIANLWNAYIANQPDKAGIDAADVAQMMVLLKMARLQAGYHHDSLVDELGYGLTHQLIAEG